MSEDKVTFRFHGKTLQGRAGTSVAVALWENGIRDLSHSPKYGRPRGVACARGQCTSCLMRVDGVPNVRTCETEVCEGMIVERQDAGAFYAPAMQKTLGAGGALFPVGFYYKWFTKPAALSRFFLNQIRPLTGVGRLPEGGRDLLPPTPSDQAPAEDLGRRGTIVVGGGPAGLDAALNAEGPVLVLDENEAIGGQRRAALDEVAAGRKDGLQRFPVLADAHARLAELAARAGEKNYLEFRGDSRVIAGYHPDGLLLRRGDTLATARFDELVWAGGALDTLGLFPGNDTPGVIGPRALYRLLERDGLDVTGRDVLVIGGGLDFWLGTALLASRGARVSLVLSESGWQSEVSAAVDQKWQLTTGLRLKDIRPHGGQKVVATLIPRHTAPGPLHSHLRLEADLAVICKRGKPTYDIPFQVGADLVLDAERGGFVPTDIDRTGPNLRVVGEAAGLLPGAPVSAPAEEPTP